MVTLNRIKVATKKNIQKQKVNFTQYFKQNVKLKIIKKKKKINTFLFLNFKQNTIGFNLEALKQLKEEYNLERSAEFFDNEEPEETTTKKRKHIVVSQQID